MMNLRIDIISKLINLPENRIESIVEYSYRISGFIDYDLMKSLIRNTERKDFITLFHNFTQYKYGEYINRDILLNVMNDDDGFIDILSSFMIVDYECGSIIGRDKFNEYLEEFIYYLNEEYDLDLIFVHLGEESDVVPRLDTHCEWKLILE